ncbi:MAG: hypothetical protein Unbinned80contig1000_50 [Prokaryotic dsDNA virus sp.]|nr:MAG: hypothetical protein Unbinned80contig1000_50 [Prokaryotic dsDNA virus sp.]|tara:strand:+ start:2309 stop:2533 length:225 start_codon:yes stop_codon:yes gene_type:complete
MSHQIQLQILRLDGWTDEKLSVEIGEMLGGEGPSTQTIYRWRTGKTRPARVFQGVLQRLYDNNNPNGAGNGKDN